MECSRVCVCLQLPDRESGLGMQPTVLGIQTVENRTVEVKPLPFLNLVAKPCMDTCVGGPRPRCSLKCCYVVPKVVTVILH